MKQKLFLAGFISFSLFLFIGFSETAPGVKIITVIDSIPVKSDTVSNVLYYVSGMQIDADGSPRAYHPVPDSGLDALANAGHNGNWWGIVTDKKGKPFVQGNDDPAPGFYISTTSLQDVSKKVNDPARYVNSETIPFFVLPGNSALLTLVKKGDMAYVRNLRNGKNACAIFADVGPKNKIGEGSVCLAQMLGINSSPRNGGVQDSIVYFVFPGSGNGKPRTVAEIDSIGKARYAVFIRERKPEFYAH